MRKKELRFFRTDQQAREYLQKAKGNWVEGQPLSEWCPEAPILALSKNSRGGYAFISTLDIKAYHDNSFGFLDVVGGGFLVTLPPALQRRPWS